MPHVVIAGSIHESGIKTIAMREDFTYTYLPDNEDLSYKKLIKEADALVIRTQFLSREDIINTKKLQIVSRHGVGYDSVDVAALSEKDIVLSIVGNVNSQSVAEHSMALLLATFKRLIKNDQAVRNGPWSYRNNLEPQEIFGKSLLILGYGRVGRRLAKMAKAFGMKVFAYDPFIESSQWPDESSLKIERLEDGLSFADCISINMPKVKEVLIDHREFLLMKNGVVLVNTARGGIINENALLNSLKSGKVGAAGLDVFDDEQPSSENLFKFFNQVVLSPHVAGLTKEAAEAMAVSSVKNVIDYFDGKLDQSLVVNNKN
jgi:D-3-phosphoglycerate dehydrogenase